MHNEKKISLTFDLGQVANDVLAKCNLISRSVRDEAMADIRASVQEPDSPETRSIINRAITEAFGKIKRLCQRYLKQGRTIDNNGLERMVKRVTYVKEQAKDAQGHLLFSCTEDGVPHEVYHGTDAWIDSITLTPVIPDEYPEPIIVDTDEVDTIEYEKILIELYIPNFNVAVTDHMKSCMHKLAVDYITARFLQDQLPDKAAEYKALADGEDSSNIIKDINARENYNFRKATWI